MQNDICRKIVRNVGGTAESNAFRPCAVQMQQRAKSFFYAVNPVRKNTGSGQNRKGMRYK